MAYEKPLHKSGLKWPTCKLAQQITVTEERSKRPSFRGYSEILGIFRGCVFLEV